MMPDYIAIKMKNGSDLVGVLNYEAEEFIRIENPIEIKIDPVHGFYAKSWLLLTVGNIAAISREDIMVLDEANEKAVQYYEEFIYRIRGESKQSEVSYDDLPDDEDDLQSMFETLLESKNSIKH